jgi:ribosomal protein S18 acetylase RimI-like enzyme
MIKPLGVDTNIRDGKLADAAEIARLLTILDHPTSAMDVESTWESWTAGGGRAFVVSSERDVLTGLITLQSMVVLHRRQPVGRITALIVDSNARRSGIGRALMRAAEEYFVAAGCGLIELTSNQKLTPAHAFYEHLGYQKTSVRLVKNLLDRFQ